MGHAPSRELRPSAVVGLLSVGYLVVELVSDDARCDAVSMVLLAVAGIAVGCLRWLGRIPAPQPTAAGLDAVPEPEGLRRHVLSWVGLLVAFVAVGEAPAPSSRPRTSVLLEMTSGIAAPLLAACVLEAAVAFPEPLRLPPRRRSAEFVARLALWLTVLAVATLEVLRAGGPLWMGPSGPIVVPHRAAWATVGFVLVAGLVAVVLRVARHRATPAPAARLRNDIAAVGSFVALALGSCALGIGWASGVERADPVRALLGSSLAALLAGHVGMMHPPRLAAVAPSLRAAVAMLGALGVAAIFGLALGPAPRGDSTALALRAVLVVLVAAMGHASFASLARRALAPDSGRLLRALHRARERLASANSLEAMAEATLSPLREAARNVRAAPVLYVLDPVRTVVLDAAGLAHVERRVPPEPLVSRLASRPGEVVLTDAVVADAVRQPDVRALANTLSELDALVVVPLLPADTATDGLEGAVVVPRGRRRTAVTIEEVAALDTFGRALGSRIAAWSRAERAQERTGTSFAEIARLERRVDELEHALAAKTESSPSCAPFAYSRASRAAVRAIHAVAARNEPLALIVERGTPAEPWARLAHEQSPRAAKPFVALDCTDLETDGADEGLLGAIERSSGGTLALIDVPAMPRATQQRLARAFAARSYTFGEAAVPLTCRIVATSERTLEEASVERELAQVLAAHVVVVPRLHERLEDVRSIVLRAIDRACRRAGREVLGIEERALRVLEQRALSDGERGLVLVVERAVERASGPRVNEDDVLRALHSARDATTVGAGAETGEPIGVRAKQPASRGRTEAIEPDPAKARRLS